MIFTEFKSGFYSKERYENQRNKFYNRFYSRRYNPYINLVFAGINAICLLLSLFSNAPNIVIVATNAFCALGSSYFYFDCIKDDKVLFAIEQDIAHLEKELIDTIDCVDKVN